MAGRTHDRVAETIRQRAAHVILHELKDPRMGFVTITRVKLSPDLSFCTIFWSVIGEAAQRSKTAHALDHARVYVKRRVAEGLHTRVAPEVSFAYDESVEGAIKMGGLLKQLRSERGEPPPADGDAAKSDDASPDASADDPEPSDDQ
jgi:ribosome-binding factor A